KIGRGVDCPWPGPSRPGSAGLPGPSISRQISPGAVVVRRPTPRVAGNPAITEAGRKGPAAVHERIPASAGKIRLPHRPVAGNIKETAVIVEIAGAVGVWGVTAIGVAGVLLVILILLLVPRVKRIGLQIFRHGGAVAIRQVELRSVILANVHTPRVAFDLQVPRE